MDEQTRSLKPFINIGKSGLGDAQINQIKIYLKANKIGKVKLLRTFLDSDKRTKKEIATAIATATGSKLDTLIGHTVILRK